MKVYLGKGRSEYVGSISGDIYIIDDDGTLYYYLVNILNPQDIYIVSEIKKISIKSEAEPSAKLLEFHELRKQLNTTNSNVVKEAIQKKKEEEIQKHFVYDVDATKFLLSKLGPTYEKVSLIYHGNHLFIFLIDDKWQFQIESPHNKKAKKYSLTSIEEERKEYNRKMSLLISTTHLPKQICKCVINDFTDDEAIRILRQIKMDHDNQDNLPDMFSSLQYIDRLIELTGYSKLYKLSYERRSKIYSFVFKKD